MSQLNLKGFLKNKKNTKKNLIFLFQISSKLQKAELSNDKKIVKKKKKFFLFFDSHQLVKIDIMNCHQLVSMFQPNFLHCNYKTVK